MDLSAATKGSVRKFNVDGLVAWLSRGAAWLAAVVVVYPLFYHVVRGTDGYLTLLTDDFYYYLVIAQNLAHHGVSTFDGMHPTNGYHPLYMGVLTGLTWVFGGPTRPFYFALGVLFVACAGVTFELLKKTGERLFPCSRLAGPVAAILALQAARMSLWGLEVAIAIPLHAAVLLLIARSPRLTASRAALLGFASAALGLARLDTLTFVALVAVAWLGLSNARIRDKVRGTLAFSAGALPLPLYLLSNVLLFGGMLSTSAASKQLSRGLRFNTNLLDDMLGDPIGAAALVLLPVGLVVWGLDLYRGRQASGTWLLNADRARTMVIGLSFAFPIVFYGTYGLRSDWRLFAWYFYPVLPGLLCAVLLSEQAVTRWVDARWRLALPVAASMVCVAVPSIAAAPAARRTTDWRPDSIALYSHARSLAKFGLSHPGVYAMGDRAGLTAYLLGQPVIQLEGLVADRRMVDLLEAQAPLGQVLREYKVDYLIVSVYQPLPKRDGCAVVVQPHPRQAGTHSSHMEGTFCGEPVFFAASPAGSLPGLVYTYVFDVR